MLREEKFCVRFTENEKNLFKEHLKQNRVEKS